MLEVDIKRKLKSQGSTFDLDINCRVQAREIVAIYGESGAGKTSLLRVIAGFMNPQNGIIKVGEETWFDSSKNINRKTPKRSIGYVFQESALFPNMSVMGNLQFALEKGTDKSIVDDLLGITGLESFADRMPDSLSGGQQQRAALARALVRRPEVLLLDEPLSALDHSMRVKMQDTILKTQNEYGFTTLLVTHDLSEVFKMCNRVFIMKEGEITSRGNPFEIFSKSNSVGKFSFTGEVLEISQEDVIYIVTVLISNHLTKVVADESEILDLNVGDQVLVSSKAFNPIIRKIN